MRFISLLITLGFFSSIANAEDKKAPSFQGIEKSFLQIPDDVPLAVYWYWISDNISKEGIIRDILHRSGKGSSHGRSVPKWSICRRCMDLSIHRLNVTNYLRKGNNTLRVEVANNWLNRLIGDLQLPKEQRTTWTTINPWQADSPLQSSGLLGPVQIESYLDCFRLRFYSVPHRCISSLLAIANFSLCFSSCRFPYMGFKLPSCDGSFLFFMLSF